MLLYAYNILCEMEATENDEYTLSYKVDSLTVDSKETIDWYELWYMVAILLDIDDNDNVCWRLLSIEENLVANTSRLRSC